MKSGVIYVLRNPEMTGVKIGIARHSRRRAKQLSAATGVPRPFEVSFELEVENPRQVEALVHGRLAHCRVNPRREFFHCSVDDAVRVIREVTGSASGGNREYRCPSCSRLMSVSKQVQKERMLFLCPTCGEQFPNPSYPVF